MNRDDRVRFMISLAVALALHLVIGVVFSFVNWSTRSELSPPMYVELADFVEAQDREVEPPDSDDVDLEDDEADPEPAPELDPELEGPAPETEPDEPDEPEREAVARDDPEDSDDPAPVVEDAAESDSPAFEPDAPEERDAPAEEPPATETEPEDASEPTPEPAESPEPEAPEEEAAEIAAPRGFDTRDFADQLARSDRQTETERLDPAEDPPEDALPAMTEAEREQLEQQQEELDEFIRLTEEELVALQADIGDESAEPETEADPEIAAVQERLARLHERRERLEDTAELDVTGREREEPADRNGVDRDEEAGDRDTPFRDDIIWEGDGERRILGALELPELRREDFGPQGPPPWSEFSLSFQVNAEGQVRPGSVAFSPQPSATVRRRLVEAIHGWRFSPAPGADPITARGTIVVQASS